MFSLEGVILNDLMGNEGTRCANFPKQKSPLKHLNKTCKEPRLTYVEISSDLAPSKLQTWFSDGQCSIVALAKKAQGIDVVV